MSGSAYVNRVTDTTAKSVQRVQRKCKICCEAQLSAKMIMMMIVNVIIIIIIYYYDIFFNLIYTKIIVILIIVILIIIIIILIVRMKCQQLWLLWVLKLEIKYALEGIRYANWILPLEKLASYKLHLE